MSSKITPASLLDVLGIEYFPRTNRLAMCCPIHDDRDPSAAIYLDTELAFCFSCDYTYDLTQFYAVVKGISRSTAIKDLEKRFGPATERPVRHNPKLLFAYRQRVEKKLATALKLGMKFHATLAETADRIFLAYERGQIDEEKLDKLTQIWYNRVKEMTDGFDEGRVPEAGLDGRLEEGLWDISGPGSEGDEPDLDGDGSDGAIDLA